MSVSQLLRNTRRSPILLLLFAIAFIYFRSDLVRFDPVEDLENNRNYDDVSFEFPVVSYFHDRLSKGEIPLWNPYQSAGNPVIGTLQQRLLYPPRLLPALMFGIAWGQLLEILFHFFLTIIATYAFLRTYSLHPLAAATGTLSVLLSVEFLSATYSHNVFASVAWVPACLYGVRVFAMRPVLFNSSLLALTFSMLIYAGYPQYAYYALHLCFAVFVVSLLSRRDRIFQNPIRIVLLLSLALLISVLIALPQVLTAAEFFSLGIRGVTGVSKEQFHLFGGYSPSEIFTRLYAEGKHPVLNVIPLLIFGGLVSGWFRLKRLRLHSFTMVISSIPFVLLVMGPATPFSTWVFETYPLGSSFRAPMRALYLLLFPCAFSIAVLSQALLSIRKPYGVIACFAVPVILASILLPLNRFRAHAFLHTMPYMNTFIQDLKHAIPMGSNHRFVTVTGFQTEPYRRAGMMAELRSFSEYEPSNTHRFFEYASLYSETIRTNRRDLVWLGDAMVSLKTLDDPVALRFLQAASVNHVVADSVEWKSKPDELRKRILNSSVLSRTGAIPDSRKINLLRARIGEAAFNLISQYHGEGLPLYEVFAIQGSLPRAYVSNVVSASQDIQTSIQMMQPPFNPMKGTIIEMPDTMELIPKEKFPEDSFKPATFLKDDPERILIRTETRGNAFLILNDKFFPGWECTVDGKQAPILAANILFRAVPLPPGVHEIEFTYRDDRFRNTFILSLLAYALLAGCLIGGWFMARSRAT
ncbi:MAG: hypothetical protein JNM27_00415 [Leptospirales bacterium]|nr:hypothetical protein [Leptospirales bacterium]